MVNFNFGLGGAHGDDNTTTDPATTTTDPGGATAPATDDAAGVVSDPVMAPPVATNSAPATDNVLTPESVTETTDETVADNPFGALPTDEVSTTDPPAENTDFSPFATEPSEMPTEPTVEENKTEESSLAEPDQNIFSNDNPFGEVAQTPESPAIEEKTTTEQPTTEETPVADTSEMPIFGENTTPEKSVVVEPEAVKQPVKTETEQKTIAATETETMTEMPVFEPTTETTPEPSAPTTETTTIAATGGGSAAGSDDPLSTLTEIKNEIASFVKARKSAIADLEKEIDELEKTHKKEVHERREKISAERTALKDKQQAYKKMAEELIHLTNSFGNGNGNGESGKNHGGDQKHNKKSPKKTFHPPQSRIVRPAQKNN